MVVDDEAIITVWLKEHLKAMGYDVVGTAFCGEEAVDLSNKLHPDLILMDIVMAGKIDGIEAAEIIQKNLEIPVIFITAFGEEQFINRAKALEPFGYIMKPLRKLEIKSAIEIALYKSQTQQRLQENVEKYKSLVDNCFDGIAVVQDFKIEFANPSLIRMLGSQNAEEITGHEFTKFISLEYRDTIKRLAKDKLNGIKVPDRFIFKARRKDGTFFDAEITSTLITYNGDIALQVILRDISKEKKARESLKDSEGKLNAMLQSIGDQVNMMDKNLNILWTNDATKNVFGNDIVGKKCYSVFHQRNKPCNPYPCHIIRTFNTEKVHHQETKTVKDDGQILTYYCTANVALRDELGKPKAVIEVCQDISELTRLKQELQESQDQLERKVIERTRELETQTKSLEEVNTALKVLLNKRQEDKRELEENFLTNVKGLILPYIKKIKKTRLNEQQKTILGIVESNIEKIISPFYKKLSLKYYNLTPKELNITNLIKDGHTSKQISKILNISAKTVDTHRKNIRKKIGIENKKVNLRSHLMNIH